MLASLNALVTQIRSEIKINNYSGRIGRPIYDIEVAIICVNVINDLRKVMK
jgi:hypothetical protein